MIVHALMVRSGLPDGEMRHPWTPHLGALHTPAFARPAALHGKIVTPRSLHDEPRRAAAAGCRPARHAAAARLPGRRGSLPAGAAGQGGPGQRAKPRGAPCSSLCRRPRPRCASGGGPGSQPLRRRAAQGGAALSHTARDGAPDHSGSLAGPGQPALAMRPSPAADGSSERWQRRQAGRQRQQLVQQRCSACGG